MPEDGLVEKTSKRGNEEAADTGPISGALSRLKHEAQQALSFGSKRVRDVTEEFTAAATQLQPGELVKDESFTLFESVGALEIMDPKMDSGCIPADDTFESDFDPSAALEATEVLWIMDQLLCLEIIWQDGYPLSQTIFTSLHIDRLIAPTNYDYSLFDERDKSLRHEDLSQNLGLVHIVLGAYCKALIKCCQLALNLIQSQTFFEEEDFVTHLFGRELLPRLGSSDAAKSLKEAFDWLARSVLEVDVSEAIEARLRFRYDFLQTLAEESNQWETVVSTIKVIQKSHYLATAIPAVFSEKVQRQLATSTPPRPMIQISWEAACEKWAMLCNDVIAAQNLTADSIIQSPHCLQRAVWVFSYRGQPCTLARAVMQDTLFSNQAVKDEFSHFDLLLTDLRDLVLVGDPLVDPQSFQIEVTTDPRHVCSRIMDSFMDKVIDEYLNLYRMVCQNRCRIRRTFTQAIPVLDALESEAMRTDQELTQAGPTQRIKDRNTGRTISFDPLTSWAKFYKLRTMAWTVQLGFETDIYLTDEIGSMYWFLALLCAQRSKLLDHIERFLVERQNGLREIILLAECASSHIWIKSLKILSEITRTISRALWKFYGLLESVGIVEPPKRAYANPRLLYEARMKPFLSVTNDSIPSFEDFEASKQHAESIKDTCSSVDEDIKVAKSLLAEIKKLTPEQGKYIGTEDEWKKEIKQMETTCVAIAVAALQLLRMREKHETDELGSLVSCSLEKKYHVWWVVPQLKERET